MSDEHDRLLMVSGTLDTSDVGGSSYSHLSNVAYAFGAELKPAPVDVQELAPVEVQEPDGSDPDGPQVKVSLGKTTSAPQAPAPVKQTAKKTAAKKTAAATKVQAPAPADS